MIPLDRQDAYRERYARHCPGYRPSHSVYEELVLRYVDPGDRALDAGCGRLGVLHNFRDHVGLAIGIDGEWNSIRDNVVLLHRVQGDLTRLPFADRSFGLILCTWVVEHLAEPEVVFAELARVLRRGGHLLILTPNAWNYVTLANRLIPRRWQKLLVREVYGRAEADTFRVCYRANWGPTLVRRLGRVGLQPEMFEYVGDPSYIAFNEPLFWLGAALERLTDLGPLRYFKVHLVGSFVKM